MDKVLNEIIQNDYLSEDLKKELKSIYQEYKQIIEGNIDRQELKKKVDEVLESMFKTAFSYSIPMNFINSSLGKMLFEIKLDIGNTMMYGVAELTIIANKSKQMIFNDYRNGYLEGIETGKQNRLLVTEDAVYEYITKVGRSPFTQEEAMNRIQTFNKMNREGLSVEEIRAVLCKTKPKK